MSICRDTVSLQNSWTTKNLFREYSSIGNIDFSWPTRKVCTIEALNKIVEKYPNELRSIIEAAINSNNATVKEKDKCVEILNKTLKNDKLELKNNGQDYWELLGYSETLVKNSDIKEFSNEYINSEVEKAENRIGNGDYSGAITIARTLLEKILLFSIEKNEAHEEFNGNLLKIYNSVKKHYGFSKCAKIGGGLVRC